MSTRTAQAHWKGGLKSGQGTMQVESGAFETRYSAASRFESESGSNPEELIGAAHAGCFSMALALMLEQAHYTPERIDTRARVQLDQQEDGYAITRIELDTQAQVPKLEAAEFEKLAQSAKTNCPVSKALKGVEITLQAALK
ncbi:hypothetical protein Tel_16185 [Candidatus Tenderia electrophaga]|uniref:Peroxiredoxin n=1 Tax=Candidatus Tenderia electrophaga TaxID=1748243 RepID=A0A0S2THE2_9GAMM|nr:hypothetical protein Tel_16185 [Candidatus Tenderia electrophaga]